MLPIWYNEYKELIEKSINNYLIDYFNHEENFWLETVKEACLYAVKWWKRIRSILALEFYLIFSWKSFDEIKDNDDILKFCIALELLHAYSLVHDDLPAMDNDILRRWQPTVWKKYWEADAVLAWDLLNSLSFEILADTWNSALIKYFWEAVWLKWMVWGQVLDLYYENNADKLNLDNLIEVHNKKTGALIEISIIWWIILSW
jgi:geranylgeranyl pyrophosphate synthase